MIIRNILKLEHIFGVVFSNLKRLLENKKKEKKEKKKSRPNPTKLSSHKFH